MTTHQGLQFLGIGVGIVMAIFVYAWLAVKLDAADRRAHRQRVKLSRRPPLRFDMPPLRMTTEVFCQYGLHPVKSVHYSTELRMDICNDCVSMRARENYMPQEIA